jgi:hypothetical protein
MPSQRSGHDVDDEDILAIGTAIRVLMERRSVDPVAAMSTLVEMATVTGAEVGDVARQVAAEDAVRPESPRYAGPRLAVPHPHGSTDGRENAPDDVRGSDAAGNR